MNENINLCEILKGHEGETFYSPIFGNVKLKRVLSKDTTLLPIEVNMVNSCYTYCFTNEGKYQMSTPNSEIMLFPSKNQRDWNKWIEEQRPKVPKTWSELQAKLGVQFMFTDCQENNRGENMNIHPNIPIEKSALALLKIYQLIEIGYGGNITNEEWDSQNTKYVIVPSHNENCYNFVIYTTPFFQDKCHIAFHTETQAEEFLKYEENIKLLKDYFMI